MKKFLIVTTVQSTVTAFLIPHIKLLESMGYEVWIATSINKEIPEELKNNKWIDINFSRNPFSKSSFVAIKQLKKLMTEKEFEGMHCHTPVAAFLSRFVANVVGQKNVIYTAHGFHFFKGAPLVNWLIYYPMEWLAARWTDKLITINEEDHQNSLKFKLRPNGKCYKVNGVGLDVEKFKKENIVFSGLKEKLGIENKDFILLTLAELNKNKNQIQTLKALKELVKENENIKYILAGQGPNENKLKEYCLENSLEQNVIFAGQVEKELIPELIQISDIVISTSIREGLGLNLLEGLASKKLIIGTKNRGHQEIIVDGENGYFVEIGDHNSIVEKIKKISKQKIELNLKTIDKFLLKNILRIMSDVYG